MLWNDTNSYIGREYWVSLTLMKSKLAFCAEILDIQSIYTIPVGYCIGYKGKVLATGLCRYDLCEKSKE